MVGASKDDVGSQTDVRSTTQRFRLCKLLYGVIVDWGGRSSAEMGTGTRSVSESHPTLFIRGAPWKSGREHKSVDFS